MRIVIITVGTAAGGGRPATALLFLNYSSVYTSVVLYQAAFREMPSPFTFYSPNKNAPNSAGLMFVQKQENAFNRVSVSSFSRAGFSLYLPDIRL